MTISVDARTREVQALATDPESSVWVSANAGSGKTYVLARRVIRLLLAGADPGAILCLTFTKAAAAEMAGRVFGVLADWTTLDDAALDEILLDYQGQPATQEMRIRARRLFARALETPGGLKIQTIHAFCERLLHQFPFEANVASSFEVLDDRASAILTAAAQQDVIAAAAAGDDPDLGLAFARVLEAASDLGIELALASIIALRDALREFIEDAGSFGHAMAMLRQALRLEPHEDVASLNARVVGEMPFSLAEIGRLIERLGASGANDKKGAERLAPFMAATSIEERADAWLDFLTTQNGKKKLRTIASIATKSIRVGWPGLEETLADELDRIEGLLEKLAAAEAFAATEALLTLGMAVIRQYERAKQARGALDFQDLVVKTAFLLNRSEAAAWVNYKLDRGLQHILVDEAQDTSPRQWQVITGLAAEFFVGEAVGQSIRTFFAVGDEKQSIYSFQGAVPAWFARQRDRIGAEAKDAQVRFDALELNLSFRSTADVLGAVDRVFSTPDAYRGLTRDEQKTVHQAARRGDPGHVSVWPPITADKLAEPEDWDAPLDRPDEKSPEVRLADRIAQTIAGWISGGAVIEATGAPIRPGNILVLTRKRGPQTDAINRALKAAGLAVSGADRLAMASHIAVLDLLAIADIVLQPRDDLALAALLKSPLIGLGEEDVFALAHEREATLWRAVEASDVPAMQAAAMRLAEWRDRADFMSPYMFFARILGPDGGRRRLVARLGPEAEDVLDEFLAQALSHEQTEVPSLQGFAAWMRSAATEIKRDADLARDEIRVMTVHGAKGLEADVVFLVDTGSKPVHASHDPKIVALADDPDDAEGAPLVWIAPGARRPAAVEAALADLREKSREEYRRLLYVGLTRARDRLIVCGTAKANIGQERIWHDLVMSALEVDGRRCDVVLPGETFESLDWRIDWSPSAPRSIVPRPAPAPPVALPDWLGQVPPPPPDVPRRLTPSAAVGFAEAEPAFPPVTALDARRDPLAASALDRGRLVHRLLQALPDHAAANRAEVARRYLDTAVPQWPDALRANLVDRVMAVLAVEGFAPIFGPGSRAEVPIAGVIETRSGPASVSGRIDRLLVTDDRVTIVDYKTNRPAPTEIAAVPESHLAQLALYRAVLQALYPDRPVDAALLWTEIPSFMPIDGAILDDQLAVILER